MGKCKVRPAMELLSEKDYELIAEAQKVISLNYDQEHYDHTVGDDIRCKNDKVYVGVNRYSIHRAGAEQVEIGTDIA